MQSHRFLMCTASKQADKHRNRLWCKRPLVPLTAVVKVYLLGCSNGCCGLCKSHLRRHKRTSMPHHTALVKYA